MHIVEAKAYIQCLSPAKKHKLYKSSINKSIHFAQRRLSNSTRVQAVASRASSACPRQKSINFIKVI